MSRLSREYQPDDWDTLREEDEKRDRGVLPSLFADPWETVHTMNQHLGVA